MRTLGEGMKMRREKTKRKRLEEKRREEQKKQVREEDETETNVLDFVSLRHGGSSLAGSLEGSLGGGHPGGMNWEHIPADLFGMLVRLHWFLVGSRW